MINSITQDLKPKTICFCRKEKQTMLDALLDNRELSEKLNKELEEIFGKKEQPKNCHFDKISLTELAEHISMYHHKYCKEMFPIISSHVRYIALKYGKHHPELISIDTLFSKSKENCQSHMMIEETVLFPRIKFIEDIHSGKKSMNGKISIESIIKVMMVEHKMSLRMLKEVRELTNNYTLPDGACSYFRIAYMELEEFELNSLQYIWLQNNILYPKALEMLKKLK